ncbi:MAG: hypothetical protein AAB680_05105 [Pseudomonadota bacterium]
MGMFSRLGLRVLALFVAAFVANFGFGATQAQAGCRFVATPCGQNQPTQNYYEQNGESQYQSDSGYDSGYQDGVRAGQAKARAHTTKHKAKARRSSTRRATAQNHSRHRATAHRSTNRTTARTSRTYRSDQANNSRRPYEMPIKDHATTYGASATGYSVPVAVFAGRGESWVSGHGQIIRYSAPHHISVQNGQNCGWGTQIAQHGQNRGNRAWVCHCEHGWQPPH